MNLKQELLTVVDALNAAGVPYALCGGLAVTIHGHPRLTRDLDFLIREDDLPRLEQVLNAAGYSMDSGRLAFDVGTPTECQLLRLMKIDGSDFLTVDLILATPNLIDVLDGRENHHIDGHTISVVSLPGLAKMKRAAGRPQDLADLHALGLKENPS